MVSCEKVQLISSSYPRGMHAGPSTEPDLIDANQIPAQLRLFVEARAHDPTYVHGAFFKKN